MKKARKGLMGIYLLKNTLTGELFVGGAPSLTNCFKYHCDTLCSSVHKNKVLQSSWDTFGPTAIEFSIVEIVSKKEHLKERVEYWRKNLNADLAEEIDLMHENSGMLSVGSDTKSELRALGLGTFDATAKELMRFYKNSRDDR
ncbi:TPA: hypothetical protein DE059_03565 [Candidatus Peribacteria bacterium]|nr:hypothetical protein [Candidatus Peribacteria bacterium]|tara:strand:- start:226 stop:654 length:429 start_codon:yes stop_codon:yes gene_type:complete